MGLGAELCGATPHSRHGSCKRVLSRRDAAGDTGLIGRHPDAEHAPSILPTPLDSLVVLAIALVPQQPAPTTAFLQQAAMWPAHSGQDTPALTRRSKHGPDSLARARSISTCSPIVA